MKRWGLVAAVAIAVIGATLLLRERFPGTGPVTIGGGRASVGQPVEVGELLSIGHVILRNHGTRPAVVERVRLLGVTDGLDLLGVRGRTLPEGGAGTFLSALGFPPGRWRSGSLSEENVVPPLPEHDPEGVMPPDALQLVIGVRATQPGIARSRAVEVTYRVGGRRYRVEWEGTIYVCAPRDEHFGRCPAENDELPFSDAVAEWPPATPARPQ